MQGRLSNDDRLVRAEESWLRARGFDDLCRLTGDYVTGRQPFFPTHYGDPDPESHEIASSLEQLNINGLLTICSQPGMREEDGQNSQRAFVDGFAKRDVAEGFATRSLYSDIYVAIFSPDGSGYNGYMVPVTLEDGRPYTWAGFSSGVDEELEHFAAVSSEAAMKELRSAWYVAAIDLVWGRNQHLWPALLEPLRSGYSMLSAHDDSE